MPRRLGLRSVGRHGLAWATYWDPKRIKLSNRACVHLWLKDTCTVWSANSSRSWIEGIIFAFDDIRNLLFFWWSWSRFRTIIIENQKLKWVFTYVHSMINDIFEKDLQILRKWVFMMPSGLGAPTSTCSTDVNLGHVSLCIPCCESKIGHTIVLQIPWLISTFNWHAS